MPMNEKVDVEDERKREILALEAKLATANLFELLGVPAGASVDDVRSAFRELSRKFHPDRYFGKNLGSFKGRLDKIFKKLVEANQTLSDPEKRQAYLDSNPFVRAAVRKAGASSGISGLFPASEAPPAPKTDDEVARDAERRARLARHPYLARATKIQDLLGAAKAHIEKKEYSHAFTQLNLATQFDPQNTEIKTLLADVRRKNDQLRSQTDYKRAVEARDRGDNAVALQALRAAVNADASNAVAAFQCALVLQETGGDPKEVSSFAQKAVEADPRNVEYRIMLGRLLEDSGMKALARKHYDEAVKLAPDNPDVKKYAKRRWPF
jgi:curved DNA-binding protein CbpA